MIGLNERAKDEVVLIEQIIKRYQVSMWTALPGIVQSYDPETMTCEVQPAIQARIQAADGSVNVVNLPMLLDCPVVFPRGGGCSLTFPIKQGDECLVVFASRGIDYWWQQGGTQPSPEARMHDLSDGFVIPGPYSQVQKIGSVSTSEVQLRSDDGQSVLGINPNTHDFNIKTPSSINISAESINMTCDAMVVNASKEFTVNCPKINLNGAISGGGLGGNNATFTGDVTAGSISLKSHTHGNTQPGNGSTGTPQ